MEKSSNRNDAIDSKPVWSDLTPRDQRLNVNANRVRVNVAKTEDSDIVTGLDAGADDYVTKPFSPKVLVARVRNVLRRAHPESPRENGRISIHGIEIDHGRHEVFCNGKLVDLSATEFLVLSFLASNPGWVFSRSQIITAVKGDDYPVTDRSVDVQILGIRKKLGELGNNIVTVRGVGYKMKDDSR